MDEKLNKLDYESFKMIVKELSPCMHDYLYVYDINNDKYYITEQALQRFKMPSCEFSDVVKSHGLFVHPDDIKLLSDDLQEIVDGKKDSHDLDYRWIGRDGSPIWINCRGRIVEDKQNDIKLMIGCINEIGKRQIADNVSGMLSEKSFQKKYAKAQDNGEKIQLLRIGIDDFKIINERHGSSYGDYVLRKVAECIQKCVGEGQFAYHIVSDEYIILDVSGELQKMKRLYDKIRSSVDEVVEQDFYKAVYTISGGVIAVDNTHSVSYEDVMKLSEFALTEAKERGKNQVYFYDNDDYKDFLRRRAIMSYMRMAVANDYKGFSLNFQPIVSLEGESLYSAEALLRYVTPGGEAISPVEFIPLLEKSGLIIPVGRWIIATALEMCKEVREKYPNFKVSINLSYIQLLKSALFDELMEAINISGLETSGLVVELTESGQIENSAAIQSVWQKLRLSGIGIAVDDFGTGYSNLFNIGNLKPNIVKIDRSFTNKAICNDYEFNLLGHISRMVHSLGLKLVIEGIETKGELDRIKEIEPDFIQGFYYSRPCTKDVFFEKYMD
ncbi:MAG: EAL domain-containing protein [Lachnospira sp.]